MFRGPLVVSVQRSAGDSAAFRTQYNMSNRTSNPTIPQEGRGGWSGTSQGGPYGTRFFFC